MLVRPASLNDLNVCLGLDHAAVSDHVWQMKVHHAQAEVEIAFQTVRLPRQVRAEFPRHLDEVIEHWQQRDGFLVAEVDGEVRGYVDLIARPWQQVAWVASLAVDPGYRRRGVAALLLQHAGRWAREKKLPRLLAEATTKNYPAVCLYQKLGFEFCGYNDHYYPNQDIALFFVQAVR